MHPTARPPAPAGQGDGTRDTGAHRPDRHCHAPGHRCCTPPPHSISPTEFRGKPGSDAHEESPATGTKTVRECWKGRACVSPPPRPSRVGKPHGAQGQPWKSPQRGSRAGGGPSLGHPLLALWDPVHPLGCRSPSPHPKSRPREPFRRSTPGTAGRTPGVGPCPPAAADTGLLSGHPVGFPCPRNRPQFWGPQG